MKSLLLFVICFGSLMGYGQYLVKDLNTAPKSSNPREFTMLYSAPNYYTYFIADDYHFSNIFDAPYIWYSVNGSLPLPITGTEGVTELVVMGNTLYFEKGRSLNKLTSPTGSIDYVASIYPQNGFDYDMHDLIVSGNKLYFLSNNSLWVSGGTSATTVEISTTLINPQGLTPIHGTQPNSVVLSAENSSGDREFVVCNGTTVTRYDINPNGDSNPTNFANVAPIGVLFSANNGSNGNELFKYNGSSTPTLVKNINPSGNSDPKVFEYLGANNLCYLVATTANEGRELWKTDGTAAGTVLVEDINQGTSSSDPQIMISRSGRLFFAATHPNSGRELWTSEGTAATTSLFYNFAPDIFLNNSWVTSSGFPSFLSSSNFSSPASFYIYTQPNLLFKNLYRVESTQQGATVSSVKLLTGTPLNGIETGETNTIFFSGFDVETGQELWKTNGTESGTNLFSNIYTEPIGSYPNMDNAVSLGSNLIFAANDGTNGREIFRSDGTAANTVLLKDCLPGVGSSTPMNLTKVGNYVYFSAYGGPSPDWNGGAELWRTDGTTAGTIFIKDIGASHVSSHPHNFKGHNNEAYFVATVGLVYQIYKTNGTVGNAAYVTYISDDDYEILNGSLVFKRYASATNKMEIWTKSLSSNTETNIFSPVNTGTSNVSILYNGSSHIIFSADSKLYSYNGTTTSEILNTDLCGGFVLVGAEVYFVATFGNEKRIYKTNGTTAGTLLVKIFSNPLTELHGLTNVNGTLYFAVNLPGTNNYAGDQTISGYLYKTNGTEAGTVIVRTYSDANKKLRILMNRLTAGIGNELFYVVEQEKIFDPNNITPDNTHKHTLMVDNLTTNPDAAKNILRIGRYGLDPKDIIGKGVLSNNHIFFSLNDRRETKGGFGNELWAYQRNCPGNVSVNSPTPPDMGRTFRSVSSITSNAKIFSNETLSYTSPPYDLERFPVTFSATTSVTLLPGFEASKNKVFRAEIGGCN